jgi:hypothetical protein
VSRPPTPALAGGIAGVAAAVIGVGLLLGAGGASRSPDGGPAPSGPVVTATANTATANTATASLPAEATSTAAPSGVQASPAAASPAAPARSPATGPETAPDVVQALCRLEPRRVTELLMGATGDEQYEALRDAIPELHTRLENLRAAAGERPGVQPVIAGVAALHGDWQVALQAHDDGDTGRGRAALARAGADVAAVGVALRGPLPNPSVCT